LTRPERSGSILPGDVITFDTRDRRLLHPSALPDAEDTEGPRPGAPVFARLADRHDRMSFPPRRPALLPAPGPLRPFFPGRLQLERLCARPSDATHSYRPLAPLAQRRPGRGIAATYATT